ncbi:MAG TPA: methionyl-tRNA formyltransferase [Candidatus Saccharimonadales bacterium]|nr:methionyl-tRNA formyltransferase [Candidatus Saccharimonadales bacterium]
MKKISEPIVFFGSGPVAAESLRLLAQDFEIEAVITKPRPPHHKGDVPVLNLAEQFNLAPYTAANKKELDGLLAKVSFKSQLGVLIDFGIIISQKVIDFFPKGIINSHFSLLPEWRGADPITFSILSGQEQTGVSLMFLVEKMDEGPLLAQAKQELPPDITTPELTKRLIHLSRSLLVDNVPKYLNGITRAFPQGDTPATYSRKLTKEDGIIDWHKPAAQIEREIRAFIEWPKSRTTLGGKEIIITKAYVAASTASQVKPGDISVIQETGLIAVATSDGSLCIERLKPSGKREMSTREFLSGYKL